MSSNRFGRVVQLHARPKERQKNLKRIKKLEQTLLFTLLLRTGDESDCRKKYKHTTTVNCFISSVGLMINSYQLKNSEPSVSLANGRKEFFFFFFWSQNFLGSNSAVYAWAAWQSACAERDIKTSWLTAFSAESCAAGDDVKSWSPHALSPTQFCLRKCFQGEKFKFFFLQFFLSAFFVSEKPPLLTHILVPLLDSAERSSFSGKWRWAFILPSFGWGVWVVIETWDFVGRCLLTYA